MTTSQESNSHNELIMGAAAEKKTRAPQLAERELRNHHRGAKPLLCSHCPGHKDSVALCRSLATSDLVNKPYLTASRQLMYTRLPFAVGPKAEKEATDCTPQNLQKQQNVAELPKLTHQASV